MTLPTIGGQKPDIAQPISNEDNEDNQPGHTGASALPPPPSGDQDVIGEDVFAAAQSELLNCLKAVRPVWDKDSKSFKMEPDFPTRINAVRLAFEYKIGRPVERRLQITANAETWEATMQNQLKTPEGIRFLRASGAITERQAEDARRKLGKDDE